MTNPSSNENLLTRKVDEGLQTVEFLRRLSKLLNLLTPARRVGFSGDNHNHAAFEGQLLDIAKAELKPKIPAHGEANDRSRKAMTVIKRFCVLHRTISRDRPSNVTSP